MLNLSYWVFTRLCVLMKAYVKMTLRSLPEIEREAEAEMERLGH